MRRFLPFFRAATVTRHHLGTGNYAPQNREDNLTNRERKAKNLSNQLTDAPIKRVADSAVQTCQERWSQASGPMAPLSGAFSQSKVDAAPAAKSDYLVLRGGFRESVQDPRLPCGAVYERHLDKNDVGG
jgi:hypothetical protein